MKQIVITGWNYQVKPNRQGDLLHRMEPVPVIDADVLQKANTTFDDIYSTIATVYAIVEMDVEQYSEADQAWLFVENLRSQSNYPVPEQSK